MITQEEVVSRREHHNMLLDPSNFFIELQKGVCRAGHQPDGIYRYFNNATPYYETLARGCFEVGVGYILTDRISIGITYAKEGTDFSYGVGPDLNNKSIQQWLADGRLEPVLTWYTLENIRRIQGFIKWDFFKLYGVRVGAKLGAGVIIPSMRLEVYNGAFGPTEPPPRSALRTRISNPMHAYPSGEFDITLQKGCVNATAIVARTVQFAVKGNTLPGLAAHQEKGFMVGGTLYLDDLLKGKIVCRE